MENVVRLGRMQPTVDCRMMCNYLKQLDERRAGGLGLWPDLTRTLKALSLPPGRAWTLTDKQNLVAVIKLFIQLLAIVDWGKANMHITWTNSWNEYILCAQRLHADFVESPFSPHPLPARRAIASEMNYLGNFNFVQHFLRPNIEAGIPTSVDKTAGVLAFVMYRWLMLTATHPDADPSGDIKKILEKHLDLDCLDNLPYLPSRQGWTRDLPGTMQFVVLWTDGQQPSQFRGQTKAQKKERNRNTRKNKKAADKILALRHPLLQNGSQNLRPPYGRCFYTDWEPCPVDQATEFILPEIPVHPWYPILERYSHPEPNPDCNDECGICKDDFEDEPCIRLNQCKHTYHIDCLAQWYETISQRGIQDLTCCHCTLSIGDSKEQEGQEKAPAQIIIERLDVSFYYTTAQYLAKKRHGDEVVQNITKALEQHFVEERPPLYRTILARIFG
jgi:hypothetical protein